jgi:hypothetical protein
MGGRVLATCAIAAIFAAGCGDEDFERQRRAAVRVELSGVIQKDRVTVSPARNLGAGPFEITISNQTDQPHTVTLEGESIKEDAGSLGPTDTRAGSEQAVPKEIEPAVLDIGTARRDSNSDLLLP